MFRLARNLATIVIICSLVTIASLEPVHASVCQIPTVTDSYPKTVEPGESLTISVTLSGSCAHWDDYYASVRVDIADMWGAIIKSSTAPLSFAVNNGGTFTETISNQLTAPSQTGSWAFEYIVYVFVSTGGNLQADYETTGFGSIQVGQAATAIQSVNSTYFSTVQTTSSLAEHTETQGITQPQVFMFGPQEWYLSLAAIFTISLFIALVCLIRQRTRK